MSIKSIVTQITGMSGLIPNFAFIDTSDSIDTITSVGYLNGAVLEGFSFSDSQMVLVTSTDGLFWYQISISNGNTSLVLPISPANVLLPVFEGDIASFTNNRGQIGSTSATIRHGGNIQAGENGIPGEFISFPTFTDTGRFIVKATSNSDDFDVTLTNMSHNQQTTYSIPDCGDDNGMLLNKAESSVFVNGNLIAADGANGVTIDSGIAATDVMLKSDSTILITTYNTPGTFTWTKNPSTKYIKVYGWTGGNGGGSGRKDVNGTNGGGAGGGPGSTFIMEGLAMLFGATESVVVGAGGQGGASVTTDSTDGNSGSQGQSSSFGSMNPTADGNGSPGAGGNSINALGGAAGTLYLSFGYWVQATLPGGAGIPGSGFPGQDIFQDSTAYGMATGGGAGAGGSNVADTGGIGGSYYALDNTTVILSGGAGGSITQNGIDGADYTATGGITTGGTGGGGGGSHGGNGGNGGQPAGGGGGGGAGLNGTFNSGRGGKGGDGMIIVVEFL